MAKTKKAKKKAAPKKAAKKKAAPKKKTAPKKKVTATKAAKKKPAKKKAAPRKPPARASAKPASRKPAKKAASKKKAAAKPEQTVDAYIASLSGWQHVVAQMLRQAARRAAPDAQESIKWGQPVYEDGGPFAYFKAFGNSINFGFWRGAELVDPHGLLTGEGDRMRHVAIHSVQDVKLQYLEELIREAVLLNRSKGDPTKEARAPEQAAPAVTA
jgi:hypothetical protein